MIGLAGSMGILLYIVFAVRKYPDLFPDEKKPFRWIKTAGYHFYLKVVCRWVYKEIDITKTRKYSKLQAILFKQNVSEEWKGLKADQYAWGLLGLVVILGGYGIWSLTEPDRDHMPYQLERPGYGQEAQQYSFQAENSDGEVEELCLNLKAQTYSEDEVKILFEEYYEALKNHMKGENSSLQEITSNLDFTALEGWDGIESSWRTSDWDIITDQGEINWKNMDIGSVQEFVYLTLEHETYSKTYEIPVTIIKTKADEVEDLQLFLEKEQEMNREEKLFYLPDEYDGNKIQYLKPKDSGGYIAVLFMFGAVIILLIYREQADINELCEKREQQMKTDYPDLISKLLILVRAGMPVKNAWKQLVREYQTHRSKEVHYAYEEMRVALLDMESGVSEGEAYLNFGRRCNQQMYLKLGSLLEQNLKKGNSGIAALLEAERTQALEDRQRTIRAEGELAGTKLLLPMVLLFAMVLIIIMVPAFKAINM